MRVVGDLSWHDPRCYAAGISEDEAHWVLLYSGREQAHKTSRSFLALKPIKQLKADDFEAFSHALSADQATFDNAWFGYLSYELRHQLETMEEASASPSAIHFPALAMSQFGVILSFDHATQQVEAFLSDDFSMDDIPSPQDYPRTAAAAAISISSNMDKNAYLSRVAAIKEALQRGDLYQANLTRKFYGKLDTTPTPFATFCALTHISPAPYSAFLKYDHKAVISSSPESFLHLDAKGSATMRPIKGSAPRGKTSQEDTSIRAALKASSKDKAENLMIVDLCRNDMSRHCKAGSIKVEHLFAIETYATVMHMVSDIHGKKLADATALDLVKDCFPPGSMTGAPKIMAMELCNQLEQAKRGIYSGAIGWFGGDGSVDLSVVIRTLLIDGDHFEFQVGGGIVLDSDPEAEWRETLIKARAIGTLLAIDESELEAL